MTAIEIAIGVTSGFWFGAVWFIARLWGVA